MTDHQAKLSVLAALDRLTVYRIVDDVAYRIRKNGRIDYWCWISNSWVPHVHDRAAATKLRSRGVEASVGFLIEAGVEP